MRISNLVRILAITLCFTLTACNTTGNRALKWGAIGAGAGATTAWVTGGSVQKGAIFGGGTGAAAGAVWK